jgi:hypothetical protein
MPPVSTGFPLVSSECLFLVHILVHIGGFWPIFGPCLTSSSPDSEGIGEWRRGSELIDAIRGFSSEKYSYRGATFVAAETIQMNRGVFGCF